MFVVDHFILFCQHVFGVIGSFWKARCVDAIQNTERQECSSKQLFFKLNISSDLPYLACVIANISF